MDLQNLMPQQAQPINRITSGQLPTELAELTEEVLGDRSNVLPSGCFYGDICLEGMCVACSYDGDDAE